MAEQRSTPGAKSNGQHETISIGSGTSSKANNEDYQMMRQRGARAYEVRAVLRAAEHFMVQSSAADRDTGGWLVANAMRNAQDLAAELNDLAKNAKETSADVGTHLALQKLRATAYQLHAAVHAADHFLDQENNEERDTGSWLIACALGLAETLASELEDLASSIKRPGSEAASSFLEVNVGRRAPTPPGRGPII